MGIVPYAGLEETYMDYTIVGHDLQVTSALQERVASLLGYLENHCDRIVSAMVTLGVLKRKKGADCQQVTVTLHLKKKRKVVVSKSNLDLYTAISQVADSLKQVVARVMKRLRPPRNERRWKRNPDFYSPTSDPA